MEKDGGRDPQWDEVRAGVRRGGGTDNGSVELKVPLNSKLANVFFCT